MKEMHGCWCRRLVLVKAKVAGKWFSMKRRYGEAELRGTAKNGVNDGFLAPFLL